MSLGVVARESVALFLIEKLEESKPAERVNPQTLPNNRTEVSEVCRRNARMTLGAVGFGERDAGNLPRHAVSALRSEMRSDPALLIGNPMFT